MPWRLLCFLSCHITLAQTLSWTKNHHHRHHHPIIATTPPISQPHHQVVLADLQRCLTHQQVLEQVAPRLTTTVDPDGSLASLVLVRLSKQLIGLDNNVRQQKEGQQQRIISPLLSLEQEQVVHQVARCLANSRRDLCNNLDALTEGTKAYAILLRLLQKMHDNGSDEDLPLIQFWNEQSDALAPYMQSHHLTGLKWAFDTFGLLNNSTITFPLTLQEAYSEHNIPFVILPGLLQDMPDLSVKTLTEQVHFGLDDIRTSTNQVVRERRQTAWQGDSDSCGPFVYGGKSMPRHDWSPVVEHVRNRLFNATNQYYDGCLLNLYPNGPSGMRYHIDPDQGTLWDFDTAVVSVGASRRFAFRAMDEPNSQPHSFVVMHGDVTYMFDDCQKRFQHTVKKADNRKDDSVRASLVFKRSWNHPARCTSHDNE